MAQEQNLKNHTRIVPIFHLGVLLVLLVNVVWSLYRLTSGFTADAVMQVIVAVALFFLAGSLRGQILTVQDRIIRLEMRLRLANVLPPTQLASVVQLLPKQLVALRFASDAELPALVNKVLAGELATQKAIKSQIKDWQGDFLRA